jgi:hypothetical protein
VELLAHFGRTGERPWATSGSISIRGLSSFCRMPFCLGLKPFFQPGLYRSRGATFQRSGAKTLWENRGVSEAEENVMDWNLWLTIGVLVVIILVAGVTRGLGGG